MRALTEPGLIDEYQFFAHPVMLGGGKRLFPQPADRLNMQLVESRTIDSRTVLLHHRRLTE